MADTLALVTGASDGIGYELARRAVEDGHRLVICSDSDAIEEAADKLRRLGGEVETVQADLSGRRGVETLWQTVEHRKIDLFFANVGQALGHAFHEQKWRDVKRLIDLNVLQTTSMLHRVGRKMRAQGGGRILVTGSIGGFVPGPYDAVYNATKSYLDSLCYALQDEWKENDVVLTCLMPGPVETEIFDRAGMQDAPIEDAKKEDPTDVARKGYEALMKGERGAIPSLPSKVITMLAGIAPQGLMAEVHRWGARPRD